MQINIALSTQTHKHTANDRCREINSFWRKKKSKIKIGFYCTFFVYKQQNVRNDFFVRIFNSWVNHTWLMRNEIKKSWFHYICCSIVNWVFLSSPRLHGNWKEMENESFFNAKLSYPIILLLTNLFVSPGFFDELHLQFSPFFYINFEYSII